MNRYLLTFYKKDNMRFISHLDLQTLFQRAMRRGNVNVAFSNGFNPHELMNIVQPLSLGYESTCELVEIDTLEPYDPADLISRLNLALPEGIKFIDCIETERKNQSTSCNTVSAEYDVISICNDIEKLNITDFLNRDSVIILKRDKKTKKMVEKDVKELVLDIHKEADTLKLKVCCASNKTVNPTNLLTALYEFSGLEFKQETIRIKRTALNR
ncbi:MAG: TIGR03936 family radical SAM-associated protein [Clostridia bacterium]|nr:TIGR03936 family radical SAM-associated protein [Clostridia bacterium]